MKFSSQLFLLFALASPAAALEIRSYDPLIHDRFVGFPGNPVMNPSFIFDATKFTGLGWFRFGVYKQCALISPSHFVWATHHLPVLSQTVRFLDSNGVIVERTVSAITSIDSDTTAPSDLLIATLNAPVPSTVKPFRWLNLANEADYLLTDLMVFGFTPPPAATTSRAGRGRILGFNSTDVDGGGPQGQTKVLQFDYLQLTGSPDDCHFTLEGGDSGSPSFATVSNQAVIVGVHTFYNNIGTIQNYDTFIPHYATKLDLEMAGMGYRMRPAHYTATTLSFSAGTQPPVLRQSHSGEIHLVLKNTGAALTGNVELALTFTASQIPSTLTVPGWVVESTGPTTWSIRKATFAAGEEIEVVAAWNVLPNVTTLALNAAIQSDTTANSLEQPSFPLIPSYAAWAQDLAASAQGDDPDKDGLVNLLEYAFGSNATSGDMLLPSGESLRPAISFDAGNIVLTYPERSDAALRGISYQVETSLDPTTLTGSTSLPLGAISSTQPYTPDIPGFVKRTITWQKDAASRFARVKVSLSE